MTVKNQEISRTRQGLLTVEEVAEYVACSTSKVDRAARRGELLRHKLGKSVRYKQADVDTWVDGARTRPQPVLELPRLPLTLPPVCRTKVPHGKTGGTSEMAKAKTKSRRNLGYGAVFPRTTKQGIVRWYLDYWDATGKRVQRVVPKAQSAEEAILALNSAVSSSLQRELGIRRKPERISFQEYGDIYLENYAKTNKRSWNTDVSYLKSLNRSLGSLFLDEIGPLQVEKYKILRHKDGVTKSTTNRCLAVLRKMLTLAVEWGYLEKDAVPKIKFFPEKDNRKERFLTDDEEQRLLASASPTLRSIIIIAVNTGMRLGEILGLRWDQIDFTAQRIRVERTKSGKIRHIEINTPLLQELTRLKSLDGRSPYVFLSEATGKPLTTVKTAFKGACRRAKKDPDDKDDPGIVGLRFHDLRHTFASRLNLAGADPVTIMELMGHSSLKMTERYTHTNIEQKRKAVEMMAKAHPVAVGPAPALLHRCDTESEGGQPVAVSSVDSVN
jgi:excisionase family DNA binding protein